MNESHHWILLRHLGFCSEPIKVSDIISAIKSRRPDVDIIVQDINRVISNRYVAFYIKRSPGIETMSYCGESEEEAVMNLLDAFQDF